MTYPDDHVTLRLDAQGMRLSIMQAIESRRNDMVQLVDEAVSAYLSGGGLERDIAVVVQDTVRSEVGRLLQQAMHEALGSSDVIRQALKRVVMNRLEVVLQVEADK